MSFHTLGCRLNFAETGEIVQGFVNRGYEVVSFGEESDVTFINTCTVTDDADSTCRRLIRKALRDSPETKLVVAGCYAQMEAEKISKMTGVDLILGNSEKYKVFEYLDEESEDIIKIDQTNEFWGASLSENEGHTRAFLKIQDGCNYICSFCIIPFARGRSRTITVENAKLRAQELVNSGFKEIVITGVNIGEYESSSGEKLIDLIKAVSSVKGLERLRMSSVEPNTLTDELLDYLSRLDIFMPHFHIPLQSGSDEILKKMRRKYDVNFYRKLIERIEERFSYFSLGADIIAGYPGETEEHFQETLDFVEEIPLTHFHVFPFSKRKGTTAARDEDQIQKIEKKKRVNTLIKMGKKKKSEFLSRQLGKSVSVLVEKNGHEGYSPGFFKIVSDEKLTGNEVYEFELKRLLPTGKVLGILK